MYEGEGSAPGGTVRALVTCVDCGRDADGDEAQAWGYRATGPGALYHLCPECADLWRAAARVSEPEDFELSWLIPSVRICSICGVEIEAAQGAVFCSECVAARELGEHS